MATTLQPAPAILPDEQLSEQPKLRVCLDPLTLIGAHAASMAAIRTGLWRLLCAGPQTAAACAEALNLNLRAVVSVLEVLATCGLVLRKGAHYQLAAGNFNAASMGMEALIEKVQGHFDSTVDLLKSGKPLAFMDDSAEQREASYSSLVGDMAEGFGSAASILAQRLTTNPRRILDVGCGAGVWSLALAAHHPAAQVVGLDFPKVLAVFKERAQTLGIAHQISELPGNMYSVELPQEPFDLVIIANVIRLEALDNARSLVKRFASAVRPGGWLLIVDALAGGTPERELQRAVYALHLALRTNIGRVYAPAEVKEWLADAGLLNPVEIDLGTHLGALGAILAEKPC